MSCAVICLGNCPITEGALHAISLSDAKSKVPSLSNSLHELSFILLASELASLWSNPLELSLFTDSLKSNARVTVTVQGISVDEVSFKAIHTSFLLAGLVATSEKKDMDGTRIFTATRIPNSAVLKATPLKITPSTNVTINSYEKEDDLIDEDNLLSDATNLLGLPPAMNANAMKDDCSGREPCENCTCGRGKSSSTKLAGVDANRNTSKGSTENQKSACGKCSLGDAFRCASCPYLGKPAFKPGQENLVLDLQDDL